MNWKPMIRQRNSKLAKAKPSPMTPLRFTPRKVVLPPKPSVYIFWKNMVFRLLIMYQGVLPARRFWAPRR